MENNEQRLNLPEREEKILEFWEREKIFEKSLANTKKGKPFIFYEGPPTANAAPGIHHVEARAFKDVIPRYKTMRGFFVPRKAGWDTHGLPVELAVEKELRLKTKKDIEHYGIAAFNEKCRQSVWRYKEEWERLTRRIGFWLDLKHPYITYETQYIETLWWIIKEFWKKGFLYKDFKIIPWCSRCQTGLSSHELGQPGAYKKVMDNSVFVRFHISGKPNESLLVWTTTPWTLPANVAVAVNPSIEYTKYKIQPTTYNLQPTTSEYVWSATMPPYDPKSPEPEIIEKRSGKALIGLQYEPPYSSDLQPTTYNLQPPYTVVGADFVETDEGTGFVHLAPAFGEEDMNVVKSEFAYSAEAAASAAKAGQNLNIKNGTNYPILETVNPDGTMKKGVIGEGKFVKDADPVVIEDLKKRGLLFSVRPYEHDYPHCWRCATPVLYYARDSWWLRTTKVKDKLVKNNKTIDWTPEHIKEGRFGEFLRELRDWAFSRERYWGTPLPVWECAQCKKREVVGSVADLARRAPKSGNTYFAVRHGESETQLLGITADSNSKYHLTERGKEQVKNAGWKLRKERFDIIIHSDVLRTTEAARILAEVLDVKKVLKDPRVREINVGVFNGKPTGDYHRFYSAREEYFEKAPPGGESLSDLRARLVDFMADTEQKYRNKKILIVSHEYPIWILDAASRGLDRNETIRIHDGKKDYIGLAGVMRIDFLSLPRDKTGEVNLHRPFVDEFYLYCPSCGGKMVRVQDVVDVWFDSGSMPFAQGHWPFAQTRNSKPETLNPQKLLYPADFIAEAVDQTRGWFYTLLAVATLLGKGAPYRHVISLGHVLDKNGQKMSKSKGNVVDPWEMIKKYGADTIRWYFFTVNPPGEPKHFDEKDLLHKQRGPLSTLWNSFVFFDTYVDKIRISKFSAKSAVPAGRRGSASGGEFRNSSNILDRWVMARLDKVTVDVTRALDRYDVVGSARLLEEFLVEDFSNWYLRRSRRRFQKPKTKEEKEEAAAVTGLALLRLSQLMAPFVPFLAEEVFRRLRPKLGLKEKSVHLCSWPLGAVSRFDFSEMDEVRKLVAAGLAERAKAGIKVRQPLQKLQITNYKLQKRDGLLELIKEEVNVKEIIFGDELKLDTVLTPELREEGWIRELIRNVQEMRKDLGLHPRHRIQLQIVADNEFSSMAGRWRKFIENETGTKVFKIGGKKVFSAEREFSLDGRELWVGIDKV